MGETQNFEGRLFAFDRVTYMHYTSIRPHDFKLVGGKRLVSCMRSGIFFCDDMNTSIFQEICRIRILLPATSYLVNIIISM